jgi:phenylpyruvate tautomerase PptA (4-oxalocrotonate tautomerase family)
VAVARVEVCWDSAPEERLDMAGAVHAALVHALRVPADDPTVLVIERGAGVVVAPSKVSDRYTIVTVTMFAGRTAETKRRVYEAIVNNLESCAIRPADVMIVLDEVSPENWGVDGGIPATEVDVGFQVDI